MKTSKPFSFTAGLCAAALYFCAVQSASAYTHAVAVTVDEDDTPFVLDSSGYVWAYLRPDELDEPVQLPNLSHVKQLVPFAALTEDGHVFTWDFDSPACPPPPPPADGNEYGGGPSPRVEAYSTPQEVAGLDDIVSIAGMGRHFLALRRDGTVIEFGRRIDVVMSALDPCEKLPLLALLKKPNKIPSISNAIAISTDGDSNEILDRNGFVYGWGNIALDKNWLTETEGSFWNNNVKVFVGKDKISIAMNGYVVALSRSARVYYWGICANGASALAGATDGITSVAKISLSTNPAYPNADILADGSVVVLYPPDRTPLLGTCIDSPNSSRAQPEYVSNIPVKVVDAALPAGSGTWTNWLLMVGADGSLWKIQLLDLGGFANLENISLP